MPAHAQGEIGGLAVLGFAAPELDLPDRTLRLDSPDHVVDQQQVREGTRPPVRFADDLDINVKHVRRAPREESPERALAVEKDARHFGVKSVAAAPVPAALQLLRRHQPVRCNQVENGFEPMAENRLGPPLRGDVRLVTHE